MSGYGELFNLKYTYDSTWETIYDISYSISLREIRCFDLVVLAPSPKPIFDK